MKIIALRGHREYGKTTTLNMLIEKLNENNTVEVLKHIGQDRVARVFLNGKIIGITTRGDTNYILEKDLKTLNKCDLYICACRTKGNTLEYLESITKNGVLIYNTKWTLLSPNNLLCNLDNYMETINNLQVDEILKQANSLL